VQTPTPTPEDPHAGAEPLEPGTLYNGMVGNQAWWFVTEENRTLRVDLSRMNDSAVWVFYARDGGGGPETARFATPGVYELPLSPAGNWGVRVKAANNATVPVTVAVD
jgi:hypothetical protein